MKNVMYHDSTIPVLSIGGYIWNISMSKQYFFTTIPAFRCEIEQKEMFNKKAFQ